MRKSYSFLMFGGKKLQYYDGLLIKADTYLHDQVFDLVQNCIKESSLKTDGVRLLDIACGEGAFSKRLLDSGIQVECADIDQESFRYKDKLRLHCVDINSQGFQNFAEENKEKFDLIVSMETIEHIENPWNFIRGLKTMCKPDGYIIVTTPNIETPYSKIFFLFKNKFNSFTEDSLESIGHINPLTEFEMRTITDKLKMRMKNVIGGGLYPILWFTFDVKRSIPWTMINLLLLPFSKKRNLSWCKLYVIKKQA